jgi:hypothetical protein
VLSVVEIVLDLHLQALDVPEELEGAGRVVAEERRGGGGEGRSGLGRTQALPVGLRAGHLLGLGLHAPAEPRRPRLVARSLLLVRTLGHLLGQVVVLPIALMVNPGLIAV